LKIGFLKYLFKTVRILQQPPKFAPVLSNRNLLASLSFAAQQAIIGQTSRITSRGLTQLNTVSATFQLKSYAGR
jgi:hypothetical protein